MCEELEMPNRQGAINTTALALGLRHPLVQEQETQQKQMVNLHLFWFSEQQLPELQVNVQFSEFPALITGDNRIIMLLNKM